MSQGLLLPLLATVVALAAAAAGVWLTSAHRRARLVVPFSAGVLIGLALFCLLPELGGKIGWRTALALFGGGYILLFIVNRYLYPVCPTCAHDHDHNACAAELHGFAVPLVAAAALHSFLDGWSIATAQVAVPLGLRLAVPLAVVVHKIPEGVALGGILRAAVLTRPAALAWCFLAEGTTLAGGLIGVLMTPHLGAAWIGWPLGLAAGWLFYLGYHAVHEEWKRRSPLAALASAACGLAVAAALRRGLEALLQ